MKRRWVYLVVVAAIIALCVGCQKVGSAVLPTMEPTAAPTVEPTVEPTPTMESTLEPNLALTPSQTPASGRLEDPKEEAAEFVQAVFEMVNQLRVKKGREELNLSATLCALATIRADELRQICEANVEQLGRVSALTNDERHTRPDGSSWLTIFFDLGVDLDWAQESVAEWMLSPKGSSKDSYNAMGMWLSTKGDRQAYLDHQFNNIGVGVVYSHGVFFACQLVSTSNEELSDSEIEEMLADIVYGQ